MSGSSHPGVPPNDEVVGRTDELHYHLREHNKARREDDRHNAAGVYFDRNKGGLSAVHLVTLNLLGVLYGDSSFGHIDENDKTEQENNQKYEA